RNAMTRPVTREARERQRQGSTALPADGSGGASPPEQLLDLALKGRGAISNRPGRYEPGDRPREDDGWSTGPADEDDLPALATTVTIDSTRSIIAWNESPDLGFDRS